MTDLRKRIDALEQRANPATLTLGIYQLDRDGSATFVSGDPSPDANLRIFLAHLQPDSLPPNKD